MAVPAAVEARRWGLRHAGRRPWALDGLDLVVEQGERVLLLGPSGSGKSTLLAALAGVLADDQGESAGALLVGGRPPRSAPGRAGLVLQDPQSQVILPRVGDDAAFGAENLGVPGDEVQARVTAALAAVGLDVPLDAMSTRLSGGQQQRLALAGVLAMRPQLVLLDEPTANLDPDGVTEVRDAVVAAVAATGATLLVVEHRVAVWAEVVDRVVVLGAHGTVVADGAPGAVLEAQGRSLAAQGVWVPGRSPAVHRAPLSASAPILDTRRLVIGRDRRPLLAVPDLALPSSRLTALTGPNGVGKSTLALTLGGLLPPVAGRILPSSALADGLRGGPSGWRSRDLLGRVSVVFQSPQHQFLAGTVRDELAVGLQALRRPRRAIEARVDELLDRLDLVRLADANPFTLSGGQQRRLSVGSALAVPPRLLLLDEPTFGQDARTWAALVDLLLEAVADGAAVVVATHDPELVALADDRLALEHGSAVPA
ncbi:MAG TPA: ATP-binding cassette domain-containing protein [Amnibacterium sp.]|jgi:energy-coupling factor transport system ATP-binding protein|nr:ATP-binding cassette domain-containing protein [Amnibacterium sp.]